MNARQLRTLRGMAAASTAAWTAAVSHTLGGGVPPSPVLVLATALLAAPFAVLLAGRRLGILRLSITVVATQLLLHAAFSVTAGLDPSAGSHVHAGPLVVTAPVASVAPDAVMSSWHLLAAAVTIVLLHRGEAILRSIARGIVRLLLPALASPAPREFAAPDTPVPAPARAVAPTRPSDVSRRGPPLVVVAA